MDDFYGLQSAAEYSEKALMTPENPVLPVNYQSMISYGVFRDGFPIFGSEDLLSAASVISEPEAASVTPEIQREEDVIKAKIASHPCYPRLIDTYIDCQKVGAPPEIVSLLEEIRRENDFYKRDTISTGFGVDPELDDFMVTYCDMLAKYQSDLARPFDEATTFLNKIQLQLTNLSTGASERSPSVGVNITSLKWALGSASELTDESAGDGAESSDDENGGREQAEEQEGLRRGEGNHLKDALFRRFGSHIGSLKVEFSKTKKKGKLPKEARQALLQWWDVHNKWPYPTEGDKIALAESTGLDQKQINNWFVNQRKRHWKASENMQLALLDNIPAPFFRD